MRPIEQTEKILESGDIIRYHAMPSVKEKQTNSQHQWRAAIILGEIYNKPISYNCLMACLTHDFYEIFTGDIPSTVKWENPQLKVVLEELESKIAVDFNMYNPLQEEKDAIKIADVVEMIMFLRESKADAEMAITRLHTHINSILARYEDGTTFNKTKILQLIY